MADPLIKLSEKDRRTFARYRRLMQVLELLDQSQPVSHIARETGMSRQAIYGVVKRYRKGGWKAVFNVAEGRGPPTLDLDQHSDLELESAAPGTSMPSLGEVARMAGVSRATASRALRGIPGVHADTAAIVREAAKRLGYERHPFVSSLMRQVRKKQVCKVSAELAWVRWDGLSNAQALEAPWLDKHLYPAAKRRAGELGYHLEFYSPEAGGMVPERLHQILESRGVRGIIIPGSPRSIHHLDLDLSRFAVVALQQTYDVNMHLVTQNRYLAMKCACRELFERGFGRIAYVPVHSSVEMRWDEAGFLIFQDLLEKPPIPILRFDEQVNALGGRFLVHYGSIHNVAPFLKDVPWDSLLAPIRQTIRNREWEPSGVRELESLLIRVWLEKFRPEVIITNSKTTMDALIGAGIRVPEDVSLFHLNWNEDVAGWSGVRQNQEQIAINAVELLTSEVELGNFGIPKNPTFLSVTGSWVEGQTLRPPYPHARSRKAPFSWLPRLQPVDPELLRSIT